MNIRKQKVGRQQGMTLLEVLIALLVLSIGLLGMAGLQATSIRNNQSAYMRSQASILAYDAIDRMRANRDAADAGSYALALDDTPGTPAANCNTSSCTPAQLAAFDLYEWTQTLANELPPVPLGNGCDGNGDCYGSITRLTVGGRTIFRVIVQWDDTRGVGNPTRMQIEAEL
mgnify:CR=1 FL=1